MNKRTKNTTIKLLATIILSISMAACSESSSSKKSNDGGSNPQNQQQSEFNQSEYANCTPSGYKLQGLYETNNYDCKVENEPATCKVVLNFDSNQCQVNFKLTATTQNQQSQQIEKNYKYGINQQKQMIAFYENQNNFLESTYENVQTNDNTKTITSFDIFTGEETIRITKK